MNIYVDFDDTITDSLETLLIIANQRYGTHITRKDIKKWSFSGVFGNVPNQEIANIFGEEEFFKRLHLKDRCLITLSGLARRNKVYIVSKVVSTEGMQRKYNWIKDNLMGFCNNLEFIGIPIRASKGDINMGGGIMIDDNVNFLNETNAKYKIFYNNHRPFDETQKWDGLEVDNWQDLLIVIKEILIKEKGVKNGKF